MFLAAAQRRCEKYNRTAYRQYDRDPSLRMLRKLRIRMTAWCLLAKMLLCFPAFVANIFITGHSSKTQRSGVLRAIITLAYSLWLCEKK